MYAPHFASKTSLNTIELKVPRADTLSVVPYLGSLTLPLCSFLVGSQLLISVQSVREMKEYNGITEFESPLFT